LPEINPENGEILLSRKLLVVTEVKNKFLEIDLKSAKKINAAAEVEDELLDPLPSVRFWKSCCTIS
jgi:hypothetical protein